MSPLATDDVDEALVAEAVTEVNRLYVERGLRAVRRLGTYLLETFFDGDPARFDAEQAHHLTWTALSRQPGLTAAPSTLWFAVRTVQQLDAFPAALGQALSASHHRRLVPVKDPEVKLSLAMAAVEQRWGVRRLADEIAALTPEAEKDPVAIAMAGMTQMERSTLEIAAASDATLKALPPEERRWLREALRHGIEEVEAVTAWLAWDARGS